MSAAAEPKHSRNPDVVRGRILDAAQAEFMTAGYAGASTNRMLALFGGSKPTMFRHFPTKRALLEAVVARIAAGWAKKIDVAAIADESPEQWLRTFARLVLQWILTDESIFVGRMAIAEGAAFPEARDTYRTLAVQPLEAILSDKLRSWTAAGLLTCTDPHRDATSFLDLTVSGLVSRKLYHVIDTLTDAELDRHTAHAVGLFLGGRRGTHTVGKAPRGRRRAPARAKTGGLMR